MRQWNPSKLEVDFGESNNSDVSVFCPIQCICCFLVEGIFKTVFQETIDHCESGKKSADTVLNNMEVTNEG